MLDFYQIVNRASLLDQQGNLVDTLVRSVVAHALTAVEFAARGVEGQRQRIGIVPRMRGRMGGRTGIRNAELFEPLGRKSGRSHRHIEHLGDRSSYRPFISGRIAEDHVVRHDASLAVGGIGQVI